jgi:hypothetical protein
MLRMLNIHMNNRHIATVKKFYTTATLAALAFLQETHRVAGRAIPLLIGVALLVFVWGVVRFMLSDDDRSRDEGKRRMAWGVIGLFVVVSVWGLVALLGTLLGVRGATATAPQSYFADAPPSGSGGPGGNSCATTGVCSDPFWSCYSPCCPDIYDPIECQSAGN